MSKIIDSLGIFKSLSEVRERLSPLQAECNKLYKEFNDIWDWDKIPYHTKKFISEKLYDGLSAEDKEKIESFRKRRKIESQGNAIFATYNDPFDPISDSWRVFNIDFKEENGEKFIDITVSSKKNEASISGFVTMYNTTANTGWINVKELEENS